MKYSAGTSVLVFFFLACACQDGAQTCDVSNPIADLPWLSQEIAHLEGGRESDPLYQFRYVAKGYYEGQRVFFFSYCCPPCSSTLPAVLLKNCAGDVVAEYNIGEDKLTLQQAIWKAEGFPCK